MWVKLLVDTVGRLRGGKVLTRSRRLEGQAQPLEVEPQDPEGVGDGVQP